MSGAVAVFDYAAWAARYPEFSQVPQDVAQMYFVEATLQHANDGTGPVSDPATQLALLNMLTAHVAALNGSGSSPLVGRVSSASEGSVSVSTDMPQMQQSAAWYQQTKYGLAYWNATRSYRTMRYRPGRTRVFDPLFQRRFF